MLDGKRVAVIRHDESDLVAETIAGIPDFVGRVYVVDDASRDATGGRAATTGGRASR